MQFRIADTFTDSLARLTNEEQKAVKTTAFDLQMSTSNPGMKFHRIERAKDPNFWSVRVNRDLRIIVHKTKDSLLLCYVDHHDKAYQWAERRRLEVHPRTGAAQLVVVREQVKDIIVPRYIETDQSSEIHTPVLQGVTSEELLGYGVPEDWIDEVLTADEDRLLEIAEFLPQEAQEAVLRLAVGETPEPAPVSTPSADPFAHPDAGRRFRVMDNVEELERALEFPWEKWTIFLHPSQRELVKKEHGGPARVAGSAGTGKTIVALHRAVYLARKNPDARVLLTTFSDSLANALRIKLHRLISNEPRLAERLEVASMNAVGERLYTAMIAKPILAKREEIETWLKQASEDVGVREFPLPFLYSEWDQVVDAWQLETWEQYRDVARIGRKTRLPESKRARLWEIFARLRELLSQAGKCTHAQIFHELAQHLQTTGKSPYDFYVVDEAQDISVAQLRFLSVAGKRKDSLFFAGDLGQRIFQQPFSWKSLGVDVRGRSHCLKVNYRTSHQIRAQADQLLAPEIADVDGVAETRKGTVSVFNGPEPEIRLFENEQEEIAHAAQWLRGLAGRLAPHEMAVFVRSDGQLRRACKAVEEAGLPYVVLDENMKTPSGKLVVSTMHFAKGLEFRAVCVMACDDEVIPLQERIETAADQAELEDIYNTERHLLYVAATRAREYLLISALDPGSEFLEDLNSGS